MERQKSSKNPRQMKSGVLYNHCQIGNGLHPYGALSLMGFNEVTQEQFKEE